MNYFFIFFEGLTRVGFEFLGVKGFDEALVILHVLLELLRLGFVDDGIKPFRCEAEFVS